MHIISITYKVSLELVDQHLEQHIEYLNEQYRLGNFHASGKKVPRTGGIILSKLSDQQELLNILAKDPFKIHDLADYELIEFIPSKTAEALKFLLE
ncbi:YciI family protein [Aureispira anguillae]|uniref:YciI family protein n=1 Tax=Aureispira anguillae TaxID=2864201 RepID=A0A916DPB8_9BACT|nr:YciI family protein [Aureispira anguillae]BDS10434.1 YciI family protein [Aureispira anguillae]